MARGSSLGAAMMSAIKGYDTPAGHVAEGKRERVPDGSRHTTSHIHIEPADGGGYTVEHHYKPKHPHTHETAGHMPHKKHVFANKEALDEFLDHTLGTADASGE